MVLSKDNIDVTEKINTESSAARKRRLRRKKLKEARALNVENNIQKESITLKESTNNIPNEQKQLPNKKKKNKCASQVLNKIESSISKETNLKDNQNFKLEEAGLSSDIGASTKPVVSKDIKNQESNCGSNLITDKNKIQQLENPLTVTEKIPGAVRLNVNKRQKNILYGYPENAENADNIKKNRKVVERESKRAVKQIQTLVSQCFCGDGSHCQELKDPNNSIIKEPTLESFKIDTRSTNLENNLEVKPQNLEPVKSESLNNLSMGKLKDTKDAQKQEGTAETELNNSSSTDASAKSREAIKAAREAKKLAKQKTKKKDDNASEDVKVKTVPSKSNVQGAQVKDNVAKTPEVSVSKTEKAKTIGPVADTKSKENIPPTDGRKTGDNVQKDLGEKLKGGDKIESTAAKPEEGKSKAELRAERRAKQEAQRAAKQETQRAAKPATEQKAAAPEVKDKEPAKSKEDKVPKAKSADKTKPKTQMQKVGWFQHLYVEKDKEPLTNIPINSNLHPAVVKLGVQLAERVVTGSNARCIALLDAIKKMVRDYSVPARTEFGRGLQAQLAGAADFLWARRAATAAETNALKHVRRHLTQLPANVDEFDAKKLLQAEIDQYIREQIDVAGEAISLTLRKKISPGDHILTYGCSSLVERALCAAWAAGVPFRATVAGARGGRGPEMLRRLRARGLPAAYVDISALSHVIDDVQKVVLGASALLANGAALGAAGSAQAALLARARNVPVLVACETHKFSERTHLDPLVTNEIGDPDELIDRTDPSSPLRDWRSNPRLTLLNVTYDVTPPGLITAVVTDLGILPCTSAPVVLRTKQAEYGM